MDFAAKLKLQYNHNDEQFVTLSPALWSALAFSEKQDITASIKVPCLTSRAPLSKGKNNANQGAKLPTCLVRARKATDLGFSKEERVIYASSSLIESVYGPDALARLDEDEGLEEEDSGYPCFVKAVELIELDEVIIGALSSAAFEYAQENEASLVDIFGPSGIVVRSGGKYTLEKEGQRLSYRVLMTGPVQQGCIVSGERTKVLAMDMSDSASNTPVSLPNGTEHTMNGDISAFSILSEQEQPELVEPQEFHATVLRQAWPESRLFPTPQKTDDDESRVFIGVSDLAKCGVFSGDWVLASGPDNQKTRLCRVFGVDTVLDSDERDHE
ncbi:hypothetical protein BCR43DRAFT_123545 [Syncephalastrum racemosum]|uniref:Uncharacterized protein n=1 Tax=Syncephalastrum racemosum TaxID=13706 RepID=A0A1X2GYZ4_SYNRA|nr:hypothetical protein BCR43DRAFT_123545 [Syncephalastrum racemosum]